VKDGAGASGVCVHRGDSSPHGAIRRWSR
jgi:hypothetical protein